MFYTIKQAKNEHTEISVMLSIYDSKKDDRHENL